MSASGYGSPIFMKNGQSKQLLANPMARAGLDMTNNNSVYSKLSVTHQSLSKLPNSFKTALEQLEEEINDLSQELSYCKKEVAILKSEQDTIVEVAKKQSQDVERYLEQETAILDEVINKQALRQKAEYCRLTEQINDVRQIKEELEDSRTLCVRKLQRVE